MILSCIFVVITFWSAAGTSGAMEVPIRSTFRITVSGSSLATCCSEASIYCWHSGHLYGLVPAICEVRPHVTSALSTLVIPFVSSLMPCSSTVRCPEWPHVWPCLRVVTPTPRPRSTPATSALGAGVKYVVSPSACIPSVHSASKRLMNSIASFCDVTGCRSLSVPHSAIQRDVSTTLPSRRVSELMSARVAHNTPAVVWEAPTAWRQQGMLCSSCTAAFA